MNASRTAFVFLTLAVAAATLRAAPDRFDRSRDRINNLLDRHRKATPLPEKPDNPFFFLVAGSEPVKPAATTAAVEPLKPVALATDDQILAYAVSRLRISGQVQRAGVAHLMINSTSYREGDLIPVRGTGETVYYVKVVRIASTEVTFGYNDVTLPVTLRN